MVAPDIGLRTCSPSSGRLCYAPEVGWRRRNTPAPPTDKKTQRRPAVAAPAFVQPGSARPRSGSSTTVTRRCRSSPARSGRCLPAGRRSRSASRGSSAGRGSSPTTASACGPACWSASTSTSSIPTSRTRSTSWHAIAARRHADPRRALAEAAAALPDRGAIRRRSPCGTLEGAKVEFLGLGQQFVAFGIHPDTGQPYRWVDDTPLDVPFEALPLVDPGQLESLKVEIDALLPRGAARTGRHRANAGPAGSGDRPRPRRAGPRRRRPRRLALDDRLSRRT